MTLSTTLLRAASLAALLGACTDNPRVVLGSNPMARSSFTPTTPARQIAVDGDSLYWMSWNVTPPPGWHGPESSLLFVTKANKDGNDAVAVAQTGYEIENVYDAYALHVDASDVYFTDDVFIDKAHQDGSGVATMVQGHDIFSGDPLINGIAMDDTTLYFTLTGGDDPSGSVMAMPKAGGPPVELAAGLGNPGELVVDDTNVYWLEQGSASGAAVERVAKTGGTSTELAQVDPATSLVLDDTNLYFITGSIIRKIAKTGGPLTVMASGLPLPDRLTGDADNLYFVLDLASIGKLSKADNSFTMLVQDAEGDPSIESLAVDDSRVYWSSEDGTISQTTK